jgi:hypothetical protein
MNPPPYNQPPPYGQPGMNPPPYNPLPPQNFGPGGQAFGMQQAMNQGAEKDCDILHRAMHGAGTDENTIINLVCSRTALERAEIRRKYIALFGKDLIERIKEELSGNFEDTVIGLFMRPPEYDAYCLYKAMKGIGTNEGVLIEILGTRNNNEINMIKQEFQRAYGKPLEKWISS